MTQPTEPKVQIPEAVMTETRELADAIHKLSIGHSAYAVAMASASVFIQAARNTGMDPKAAHELIDFLLLQIPKGKQ